MTPAARYATPIHFAVCRSRARTSGGASASADSSTIPPNSVMEKKVSRKNENWATSARVNRTTNRLTLIPPSRRLSTRYRASGITKISDRSRWVVIVSLKSVPIRIARSTDCSRLMP